MTTAPTVVLDAPDSDTPERAPRTQVRLLMVIATILVVTALQAGSEFLLPVALSVLLMFLLGPTVRWMHRHRLPESVGAALVVFGAVGVIGGGVYALSGPAGQWMHDAPSTAKKVETRFRKILRPFVGLQQSAEHLEQATSGPSGGAAPSAPSAAPGLISQIGGMTASAAANVMEVIFLTYFLLASGNMFGEKIGRIVGGTARREQMAKALGEIELHMSQYLVLNTIISAIVGASTWGLLALVGLPNALLWGAVAFVLNYIPYAGALITLVLVVAASVVAFDDTQRILIIGGGFLVIHLIEGNLIAPLILGHKMPLNPVAIFVCLLFWGWIWGVPGAIIAVPLTVMIQVICAHVEGWEPVAVMLDK